MSIDLGHAYILLSLFIIIGTSNAVNLTDGLDGLASGIIIIVVSAILLLSYLTGHKIYAEYLHINYIPMSGELAVFCAAIIGSSMGFLWFNTKPAEIFMGDIGSLSIGATIGTISLIIKHEILLAIIGGIFVIETLSVIIQVLYFRYSGGKRIFLMAPIHHHFEKKGIAESKIVIRFWIITIIFVLIGLSSLKFR